MTILNLLPSRAVAVIGAGAMGSGIAQVAAQAGHEVYLVDVFEGAAATARDRLASMLARLAAKGRITLAEADAATANIHVTDSAADLPECALVIEAIRENLDDKQALFAAVARSQPAGTLFASNTSSLDITAIAQGLPHPERVLGLHFFNPPPLMRLVEVIHGRLTSDETLTAATQLMKAWQKAPVRSTSTPGFIVNRVARPFYGEAQRMVEAGVADAATIDLAMREVGGFRMGPMELTDLIGQDVSLAVGTSVWEQTGRDERYTPTKLQRQLVADGRLGRKSGQGVFRYDASGQPLDASPDRALAVALTAGPIVTNPVGRTVAMLVNEAVDLVARGEASAEDVDTAMELGTNYPKGPIAWGAEIGFDVIAEQLRHLDAAFPGGRYRPSPALGAQVGS
ncbi:MAG TPA: 3-hydroxyacyl-CoA dehydrogenase NAD-binding domain-containing protein [Dermatophilaceae bacterium]|nr:3-hydroxyacyl-CoA dehydrogenase NAD-binding domain-containing protein [Dermatophilaceae bacterium]